MHQLDTEIRIARSRRNKATLLGFILISTAAWFLTFDVVSTLIVAGVGTLLVRLYASEEISRIEKIRNLGRE